MKAKKQMTKPKVSRTDRCFYLLSFAALAAVHLLLLIFIHRKIPVLLDSDMSSEMILGKILCEEGRIMTDSWYYSTELRVVNTQLIYALFFNFTDNWHTVRMVSTFVLHLILSCSTFFLCRQAGFNKSAPAVACGLLIPFSPQYFLIILMGCYYIPHIAVSFLTVGLLFLYGKTKKKPVRLASVAGISALAFISSLGGLRQIVVTYLPLIMAIFLICLYLFFAKGWENVRKCVYFRYLILSAVSLLFAGMGYIINVKVLLERYHFKEWDDMRFTSFNTERFATTVSDMFVTLGYKAEIVGASSLVSNVLCFVIAALLTVFIVQAIRRAGKVSTEFTLISVFFLCGIVLLILIFSLTDMDYTARYNLPVMVFAPVILALGIREADFGKAPKQTSSAVAAICIASVIGLGFININNMRTLRRQSGLEDCAAAVTEQGYTSGYATFWHSNKLTELSNGRIDMYSWKDGGNDGTRFKATGSVNSLFQWLQKVSHTEKAPEGKVFLLMSRKEVPNCMWGDKLADEDIIYSNEQYVIYGYESYQEMVNLFADFDYDMNSTEWLINGESLNGKRILHKGGISYGPYITFFKGSYEVTVKGKGLSHADVTPRNNDLMYTFPFEVISSDDREIVLDFTSQDSIDGSEIVIRNTSDEDISITDISIRWCGE